MEVSSLLRGTVSPTFPLLLILPFIICLFFSSLLYSFRSFQGSSNHLFFFLRIPPVVCGVRVQACTESMYPVCSRTRTRVLVRSGLPQDVLNGEGLTFLFYFFLNLDNHIISLSIHQINTSVIDGCEKMSRFPFTLVLNQQFLIEESLISCIYSLYITFISFFFYPPLLSKSWKTVCQMWRLSLKMSKM